MSVITAVALLGWLEVVLRPAPRRRLATDGRWFTILLLFSAWALINWGALLAGPLQRAIDSGSPNIAAQAAYDLGCLLEEQSDIEGAGSLSAGNRPRTARRARECGPRAADPGRSAGRRVGVYNGHISTTSTRFPGQPTFIVVGSRLTVGRSPQR